MVRADLDKSVQLLPAQEIINSGKIYIINDLLFVIEKWKGFHFFDVIIRDDLLVAIGENGLYLYRLSIKKDGIQASHLSTVKLQ